MDEVQPCYNPIMRAVRKMHGDVPQVPMPDFTTWKRVLLQNVDYNTRMVLESIGKPTVREVYVLLVVHAHIVNVHKSCVYHGCSEDELAMYACVMKQCTLVLRQNRQNTIEAYNARRFLDVH